MEDNYLRGAIDLLPELTGIQIGIKRIELTNKINKIGEFAKLGILEEKCTHFGVY